MTNLNGIKILFFLVVAFCFASGAPIAFATGDGGSTDTTVVDLTGPPSIRPGSPGGSSRYGLDGEWMKSFVASEPPPTHRSITINDFHEPSSFDWSSKGKALYRVNREIVQMVREDAKSRAEGKLKETILDAASKHSQAVPFLRTPYENMKMFSETYPSMVYQDVEDNFTLFERIIYYLGYGEGDDPEMMLDNAIEGRARAYQKLNFDNLKNAIGIPDNPLKSMRTKLSNATQRLVAAYKGEKE